ncbi:hypothetical protein ANBU17_28940 [Anaerostipes butyraticus]|uniref:Uncharacterized protein n=1 Tax=Anaerostipes butyraticus TaxID=645466 RepID=A0A916Q905_9FIRM|nr:hypothetical protein ANBU17_28940 [Anaerostipes butyraticus]
MKEDAEIMPVLRESTRHEVYVSAKRKKNQGKTIIQKERRKKDTGIQTRREMEKEEC